MELPNSLGLKKLSPNVTVSWAKSLHSIWGYSSYKELMAYINHPFKKVMHKSSANLNVRCVMGSPVKCMHCIDWKAPEMQGIQTTNINR